MQILRDIIKSSIKDQNLTQDFLIAWGEYKAATVMVNLTNMVAEANFDRNFKNAKRSLVGRHIYAYWMHQHCIIGERAKEEAYTEFDAIINNALESKKLKPLHKSILREMMKDGHLKSTYTHMTLDKIKEINDAALIPRHELPQFD